MHRRPNRQVRLKSRPSGIPRAEQFEIVEAPVPTPCEGQVLVRNIYLSVDPAMRGWVSAAANYSDPVALGAVMRSLAVGRVEESRNSDFHPGEYVTGLFGWQDYAVVDAEAIERKVGGSGLPISTSLGVLGLNGLTAYFALLDIGQPKAGEIVVVSTAAGAVGSCVGQIAKIKGCRTVGIAGGPDKVRICRQSSPSELEWLHAGMAVMGATRESCTWTDLKHQVGVKEAGGPVSRSRPATADGPRPV